MVNKSQGNSQTPERGFLHGLGIYTDIAANSDGESIQGTIFARFYLQSLARKLLGYKHRTNACLRVIQPMETHAEIRARGIETVKTSYGKLIKCASIWTCPICAISISETRRKELSHAITSHENNGNTIMMATYTLSHFRSDKLINTLTDLKKARRVFKSGRKWSTIKSTYGIIGSIAASEVTWGKNGWHPHIHEILFLTGHFDEKLAHSLERDLQERWIEAIGDFGRIGVKGVAFKLTASSRYTSEYVAKFGHEPAMGYDWDFSHEATKQVSKRAKNKDHASPIELLTAWGNGSKIAGDLWLEYTSAFYRKQQLVWSKGLKDLFGIADISDEQASEDGNVGYYVLAEINADIWAQLMARDRFGMVRAKMLQIGQKEGGRGIENYIEEILSEYETPEQEDVNQTRGL